MVMLVIANILLTIYLVWKVSELKDSLMTEKFTNRNETSPDQIMKEWFYGGDV